MRDIMHIISLVLYLISARVIIIIINTSVAFIIYHSLSLF